LSSFAEFKSETSFKKYIGRKKVKLQVALNQHLKKYHPSLEQETVIGPYYNCDECGREPWAELLLFYDYD